jgi:hypothetical protein
MSDKPTPEEDAQWQRRLASRANNHAWSLSEQSVRDAQEDEQMLQAAHAAMYFWNIVGNENNKAHAAQLLAHVYAKLNLPHPATHYLAKSEPILLSNSAKPWERALANAVAANVAAAKGDETSHRTYYLKAVEQIAELPDPQDRAILEATIRALPVPLT